MESKEYTVMYEVEDTHFWYVGMREITKTLLDIVLNKRKENSILDAGCGTGANIIFLRQYGKVQGFDISKKAVDLCKKRGIKNVTTGNITNIKYKKDTFNLVTCFDVLGQFEVKNDKRAVKEFNRVLKPDGILLIRIAAYDWLKGYHDKHVHTKHRYTVTELEKLLQKENFTIIRKTYANSTLFPLAVIRRLIIDKLFDNNKNGESDVQNIHPIINKFLLFFLRIESFILQYMDLPFGLSVIVVASKSD